MINRQRGVALLMVLFILALMMILASAMTERTAVMYQHTAVTLDNLQARWYALAAENMAAALLQRDALDSPSQTNLAQTWAQEGRRFTLDDGEIRATIRDGIAKVNIFTDLCCAGADAMARGGDYLAIRRAKVAAIQAAVERKMQLFGSDGKS